MNPSPHILVIDDEPQILRALRTILTAHNYQVSTASRGEDGLTQAAAINPDVILLDLGLPDMDGIEVCEQLRSWTQTPIIVLTVRDSEKQKVIALDKGADDYLTKPFGIEELLARIRVALRHSSQDKGSSEPVIQVGDLTIDLAKYQVTRGNQQIKLTSTEYKLLAYMAANEGRVLTHQIILSNVWGFEYMDNVEYLRVYMNQLRKKIEVDPNNPRILTTEPGIGYRFSSE
jgi:two-component system KDP operon response regulator KdpE